MPEKRASVQLVVKRPSQFRSHPSSSDRLSTTVSTPFLVLRELELMPEPFVENMESGSQAIEEVNENALIPLLVKSVGEVTRFSVCAGAEGITRDRVGEAQRERGNEAGRRRYLAKGKKRNCRTHA